MILVTGCAGFIGSHLCEKLIALKHDVIGVDNFDAYYSWQLKKKNLAPLLPKRGFKFIRADVTDERKVKQIFARQQISMVVHLAARPGVSASIKHPLIYEKINVLGTLTLLKQLRGRQTYFILGSSSSVYGGVKKLPYTEDMKLPAPISPYGASKLTAEFYTRFFHQTYQIPSTILRFFTVYGPRVRPDMAIFKFIRLIKNNQAVVLYNRGVVKRDFTYIDDIIEGIMKVIEIKPKFNIINLGNHKAVSVTEVVKDLARIMNKRVKIKSAPLPVGEMPATWADINQATKILKWRPQVSLETGLSKTVEWFMKEKATAKFSPPTRKPMGSKPKDE